MEQHPIIYDCHLPGSRHIVENLHDLPLYDERGAEHKIFDPDGKKIPRRGARLGDNSGHCGILVNLRTIDSLFYPDEDDAHDSGLDNDDLSADENHQSCSPKPRKLPGHMSVYPQAFLRDYGHIQTSATLDIISSAIDRINLNVCRDENAQDSDTFSDWDYPPPTDRAVFHVSTQMYNSVQHRMSTKAGSLDVQRGKVTAALSGTHSDVPTIQKAADALKRYCDTALPHKRFQQRIDIDDCPTELRVETVQYIDMSKLLPNRRDGA